MDPEWCPLGNAWRVYTVSPRHGALCGRSHWPLHASNSYHLSSSVNEQSSEAWVPEWLWALIGHRFSVAG